MGLIAADRTDYGFFDAEALKALGDRYHDAYVAAKPFPSIAIDDFLDERVLDLCLERFPGRDKPVARAHERAQELYKTSYHPDDLDPALRSLFYSFNSRPFILFLEHLTGIKGLIPDPYFAGGGFHQTTNGGHLDVHADFNLHKKLNLERRINALIYLNKGWQESYGGCLELWDEEMKGCVKKIAPVFNRCVVFSTTSTSYHGHPDPVAHPEGMPRRSIALYYYTATWDGTKRSHTTQFRVRPGSTDTFDAKVFMRELAEDWLPPALSRLMKRKSPAPTRADYTTE